MLQAIRGSGEAMRSTLSGRENAVARRYNFVFLLILKININQVYCKHSRLLYPPNLL